jgi:hydrophobe/amphiphile efflux-3 (HAE3) family protein
VWFYKNVSRIVRAHPWVVIIVSLLLTVGFGIGVMFIQGQVTYEALLPRGFPSIKALKDLAKDFDGIAYETVLIRAPDATDSRITQFLVGLEDFINQDPRFNKGQIVRLPGQAGNNVPQILRQPVPVIQDYLSPFIANVKQGIAQSGFDFALSGLTDQIIKAQTGMDWRELVHTQYLSQSQVQQSMVGPEKFITSDYKATQLLIKVNPRLNGQQQVRLAKDLENLFKTKLAGVKGLKLNFSGDATLARDFNNHIKNKTILLFVLSIGFVILALFLAFRRVTDTIIPIAIMLMSLVWTFGIMGYAGIPYSVASVAIMPLLLGHALTFVVPFAARYYEEEEGVHGALVAISRTLSSVGVALFPAAATSVVGFLVFLFSVLPPLRDFGVTAAIGTAFIFILSITVLPAVMLVRDKRIWVAPPEKREKLQTHFDGFRRRQKQSLFARGTNKALEWFTHVSTQHSLAVITVSIILIAIGFAGSFGLTTDSDLRKLVPRDLPAIHSDFEVEKMFGPDQTDVILVKGDVRTPQAVKAMAELENAIYKDPRNKFYTYDKKTRTYTTGYHYTREAISGLPEVVLGATNGVMPTDENGILAALKTAADNGGYVGGVLSPSNREALVSLNGLAAASPEVLNTKLAILQDNARKYLTPAGLSFELGGITPLTKDMTKNIIPTETWSSILSLIVCGLLLMLIFRSIPYGLITLTVAFAGAAAEVGFLALMSWPIDVVTSLVSALVIAIGSNFGILFTHRFIQSMRNEDVLPVEAIHNTMMNLGRANVVAAISTCAGFLIIMLSQIEPLKRFGGVTAFGIFWSLIASLTIMPALLYRFSGHTRMIQEEHLLTPEPQADNA